MTNNFLNFILLPLLFCSNVYSNQFLPILTKVSHDSKNNSLSITGTLPDPCYSSPEVTVDHIDIGTSQVFLSVATVAPNDFDAMCIQVLKNFVLVYSLYDIHLPDDRPYEVLFLNTIRNDSVDDRIAISNKNYIYDFQNAGEKSTKIGRLDKQLRDFLYIMTIDGVEKELFTPNLNLDALIGQEIIASGYSVLSPETTPFRNPKAQPLLFVPVSVSSK